MSRVHISFVVTIAATDQLTFWLMTKYTMGGSRTKRNPSALGRGFSKIQLVSGAYTNQVSNPCEPLH